MRPDITISVLGMWQFNNALFDNFTVPAQIDKQDVVDSILLECAELPVVYTNWDILQGAIGLLSKRRLHAWERMAKALFISIHAPRVGSDCVRLRDVLAAEYFNPRSPCGERP